jgi:hypothetical protein
LDGSIPVNEQDIETNMKKEQRENDENRQRNRGLHAEKAQQRKPSDEGEWAKNNCAAI